MKRFAEYHDSHRDQENLEEGIVRKGTAIALGARHRSLKTKAIGHLRQADQRLSKVSSSDNTTSKIDLVADALSDLMAAQEKLMEMSGTNISVAVASVVLSDNLKSTVTAALKGRKR